MMVAAAAAAATAVAILRVLIGNRENGLVNFAKRFLLLRHFLMHSRRSRLSAEIFCENSTLKV